jgi:hypothetical protein
MTAADDGGSREDRAADYDGEGRERAVRDGGNSGVAMMAVAKMAAAEDSSGGRQQQWLAASMRAAAADDGVDGSRRGGRGRGPGEECDAEWNGICVLPSLKLHTVISVVSTVIPVSTLPYICRS